MSILIYSKMTVASVAADGGNTAGKGVITLGSAVAPYLSAAAVGASDQQTLSYVISEGARVQACRGVYTANSGTLTRATTYLSTAGAGVNEVFDSGAVVTFSALPADIPQSAADLFALLGYTPANPGAATNFTAGLQSGGNFVLTTVGGTVNNLTSLGTVTVTGGAPATSLNNTSNGTDLKVWNKTVDAQGAMINYAVNDANTAANYATRVTRSAGTPNGFYFFCNVFAASDNTYSLGGPSNRFSQVFAGTSTISTSDARMKDWRGGLNEAELRVARRLASLVGIYRWKDAVEKKKDEARLHVGWRAQEVRDAFAAEGLNGRAYGILCYDAWDKDPGSPPEPAIPAQEAVEEERDPETGEVTREARPAVPGLPALPGVPARPAGDSWGLREGELRAFVIAGQEQRLAALEAKAA